MDQLGTMIKNLVKRLIHWFVRLTRRTAVGEYFHDQVVDYAVGRTAKIRHGAQELTFAIPNRQCRWRAETFSSKEPETLQWFDAIPRGSVVWDIGANVGLYTCYAAKARDCRVFAFEPSVFNLELLARNIYLNGVTDRVTIVPLPLSDKLAFSKLNMTTTEWGGALSTFGNAYGYDGQAMDKAFEFPTVGLSMQDASELLGIPLPDYVKMDVDGIEHLILKGGAVVLRHTQSVLVEINDEFEQQAVDSARYLSAAGLRLSEKRRWEGTDNTLFDSTYNQIWHRDHGV